MKEAILENFAGLFLKIYTLMPYFIKPCFSSYTINYNHFHMLAF